MYLQINLMTALWSEDGEARTTRSVIDTELGEDSDEVHNYYLYHHPNGKWGLLPQDMDKSLSYYDWMPYQYHKTSSNWESDNPLVERALLNPQILSDIKIRLGEIGKTSADINTIFPVIDDLEKLLDTSIRFDTSDQVNDLAVWKNYLEKEFYGKVKTDFDYQKFINT